MRYIDADKLIAEIINRMMSVNLEELGNFGCHRVWAYNDVKNLITSLQQEQSEIDMKSQFTGGKVTILSREEEVTFRGEKVKITRKYYRCEDTGREFTNDKLDDDIMWAVFRAYCEKKGMTSFTDIMLKQEQPEVDLEKDDIIDYVHSHFYYDKDFDGYGHSKLRPVFTRDDIEVIARHFYELGLNARKEG